LRPARWIFSGSLGSFYTAAGLDTAVGDAVTAATGFAPLGAAVAAKVAGGSIPVPHLSPELATVPPFPALGTVTFSIKADADGDGDPGRSGSAVSSRTP